MGVFEPGNKEPGVKGCMLEIMETGGGDGVVLGLLMSKPGFCFFHLVLRF